MSFLNIAGRKFEIIDTLEYITMADSFVKNKIGTGHGEAKLYVGNIAGQSPRVLQFFGNFTSKCFFLKSDFGRFLQDARSEYENPQQEYVRKSEMPSLLTQNQEKVNSLNAELIEFSIYRVNVAPPRVYINSNSSIYDLMRSVCLPNISYLSIMKLRNEASQEFFYFKMFIDYKSDIVKYTSPEETREKEAIEVNDKLSRRVKESLIQSRIGQGDYRSRLLLECPYCPFTLVNDERLLVASHIKPWVSSNDSEKIDSKNGFMLTPTFDKLFDKGFISFTEDKKLLVSPWLSPMNQKRLGIYNEKDMTYLPMDEQRVKYLKYHRENIFKD